MDESVSNPPEAFFSNGNDPARWVTASASCEGIHKIDEREFSPMVTSEPSSREATGGTSQRRRGRRLLLVFALAVPGVLVAPAGVAPADPACTGEYVKSLVVNDTDYTGKKVTPDFRISITPTAAARKATLKLEVQKVTVSMWHTVQRCVPGLYHSLADSVWQQLECHVLYGVASNKTGPTYDLESWHMPLSAPNPKKYFDTECLNVVTPELKGKGILIPGALDLRYGSYT